MTATNHDGLSNENVKTNGVLSRNRQIHYTVAWKSIIFGRRSLWPSLSNPSKGLAIVKTLSQGGSTMTATNHDDQLGEIFPTMLNKLNCTFGVSCSLTARKSYPGHRSSDGDPACMWVDRKESRRISS